MTSARVITREDRTWERVCFAEVLIPNVANNFGDIYTPEAIRDFCYEFARMGYGLDVDHDKVDVTGTGYYVVESFLARAGDPDFIEGSWVVGIKVVDDDIWQRILDGDLNGFSYEALVNMVEVEFTGTSGRVVVGTTSPHPIDGHTHTYTVVVDETNQPISGGTSEEDGHSHTITNHTTTDVSAGHNHRYQVINP